MLKFILFIVILYFILQYCRAAGFHGSRDNRPKKQNRPSHDIIKDLSLHPRSRTEAEIIKVAEEILNCQMPTVNPAWLVWQGRTLELDGYCEAEKVALEFSGPQHTKWFPGKESYETYLTRVHKDKFKRKECAKKGICLIVVDMRLPHQHWRNYILSRLYDCYPLKWHRPINYILKQKEKPFIRG